MQIQICWFTPVLSWTRYPFVPVLRSITEMIAVLETTVTRLMSPMFLFTCYWWFMQIRRCLKPRSGAGNVRPREASSHVKMLATSSTSVVDWVSTRTSSSRAKISVNNPTSGSLPVHFRFTSRSIQSNPVIVSKRILTFSTQLSLNFHYL